VTEPGPEQLPPLSGVRVIEFGNLVAAPYCGMLLADLGAEVVKVEPVTGDLAREIGPFVNGESCFFIAINRGKKSLAVDPKHPDLGAALFRICVAADVVVHNLRRGAMERIGLGHTQLRPFAPGLIYAVISAFGTTGPDADRPGIDLVFQGESGMMSLTGSGDDPPHKTATTIGDFVAGTNAALAICASLTGRRHGSGSGRLIETSVRDGLIAVQAGWNAQFFASGSQPPRTGTASPVTAPNQTFATSDGYLNLAVVSDRHFADTCRVLGRTDLIDDHRFTSNEMRVANRAQLEGILGPILAGASTGEWIQRMGRAGLPVGRILTLPEVFSDSQVIHNEMVVDSDHPVAGWVRTQGSPLRVDGRPARAGRAAPVLGQHSSQLLVELGLSPARIAQLAEDGQLVRGGLS
jgi:crotonobetainyl-CoA:carnitine CoA-transferase CaiB-like acyl-CoA transferase